jgi:RNA polymerase sigma factor (sigma-70 family)
MLWSKNKRLYTDNEIIEGFRTTDYKVLQYVYSTYYKIVENFILKHGGKSEDAKDNFQEGLSIVLMKITNDDLTLNSSFSTYLFSICKNIWLNEHRKRRYMQVYHIGNDDTIMDTGAEFDEDEIILLKKERLFRKHFKNLDELCKKLISFHLNKVSFKEIADKLGFKDEMQAIRRKAKCKEYLIKKIKNDPEYNELL